MLEKLADYDDALMEQLISDIEPPRDRVFDDLAKELREGHVVPVLIGSATAGHGVTRLLKALRHEAPGVAQSRARLGVEENGPALAQVLRTVHTAHGGKLSLARVLRGAFADGAAVVGSRGSEERIAGVARLTGAVTAKLAKAEEGDTVAFARLEGFAHRRPLQRQQEAARGRGDPAARRRTPRRSRSSPRTARTRSGSPRRWPSCARRTPRSPIVQDQESAELKLFGQGEMHLRVIVERLAGRFGVVVETKKPSVAYRETIRDPVTVRGRHKKQSGGHGQFGDVRGRGRRRAAAAKASPSPSASTAARCRGSISRRSRRARATR